MNIMVINVNSVIVDVNKIEDNITAIEEKTKKKIIAVVKSNAYSLNSRYIVSYLKKVNVKYFAFNELDEYLEIKDVLDGTECLIMNSSNKFSDFSNIHYTINNMDDLQYLLSLNKKVKVQIQIDTGMNRLGIRSMTEFLKILSIVKNNRNFIYTGIYTHFSSCKEEKCYYERQKNRFLDFVNISKPEIVHSAATSSLTKNIVGNYVRVGMAMYGLTDDAFLKSAVYVKTTIINEFFVRTNDLIGYGQDKITKNSHIAIIPLGYYEVADFKQIYYLIKENGNVLWQKLKVFGKSCMNHRFIITNFALKKFSYLYLFIKNDTIYTDKYRFLVSTANIYKRYIEVKSDLSKVFKTTNKKGVTLRKRGYGYKIINFRIV